MTNNIIDICNVNIRKLSDIKVDVIKAELMLDIDVICLTGSNLPHAQVTDLKLLGFHEVLRKDLAGRLGGSSICSRTLRSVVHVGHCHLATNRLLFH